MARHFTLLALAICCMLQSSLVGQEIVKDPTQFYASGKRLFSGTQRGEKLPQLNVVGVGGDLNKKEFDAAAFTDDSPVLLAFIDDSELGGKTTYYLGKLSDAIKSNASKRLRIVLVYVGDDPEKIQKEVAGVRKYLPMKLTIAYSRDGRDGPGALGLNRNVPVTMILAHQRKVLHNFAFGQHVFQIDPHVAGAVAEAVGADHKTLAKWLTKGDKKDSMMNKMSVVNAWVGWAKNAKSDEIADALKSDKFADLSENQQLAIKKAIRKLAGQ